LRLYLVLAVCTGWLRWLPDKLAGQRVGCVGYCKLALDA